MEITAIGSMGIARVTQLVTALLAMFEEDTTAKKHEIRNKFLNRRKSAGNFEEIESNFNLLWKMALSGHWGTVLGVAKTVVAENRQYYGREYVTPGNFAKLRDMVSMRFQGLPDKNHYKDFVTEALSLALREVLERDTDLPVRAKEKPQERKTERKDDLPDRIRTWAEEDGNQEKIQENTHAAVNEAAEALGVPESRKRLVAGIFFELKKEYKEEKDDLPNQIRAWAEKGNNRVKIYGDLKQVVAEACKALEVPENRTALVRGIFGDLRDSVNGKDRNVAQQEVANQVANAWLEAGKNRSAVYFAESEVRLKSTAENIKKIGGINAYLPVGCIMTALRKRAERDAAPADVTDLKAFARKHEKQRANGR